MKPVVFVLGGSGNAGSAILASLATEYADKVEIRAGVRNPEKADKIKSLAGVKIVRAAMGDENLVHVFAGVDTLLIVTPSGTLTRAKLVVSSAELAKKAGVKHMAIISGLTADQPGELNSHLKEIESKVSQLDIQYTFIRLTFFTENIWGSLPSILKNGAIESAVDPDKPFPQVAVDDIGRASAAILVNPSEYVNKTIYLASEKITFNEISRCFSAALGKEIKYVRVSYEAYKKDLIDIGMAEWQVNGILQSYKLVDNSDVVMTQDIVGVYKEITGEDPTDMTKWLAKYAAGFRGDMQ